MKFRSMSMVLSLSMVDCHLILWIFTGSVRFYLFSLFYQLKMMNAHTKIVDLQESLKALKIWPTAENPLINVEKVLLGKLVMIRKYSRNAFTKTIVEAWNLESRVRLEKLSDDTFKFLFSNKSYRDCVSK